MMARASDVIRYGPYVAPAVQIGDYVMDEARGMVRVHSIVPAGRLMWPRGIRDGRSPGRPALIVMGDLVRAVRQESSAAVMAHWGVSEPQVWRWRKALGVGRLTPGTIEVFRANGNMDIGQYGVLGAAALNADPEAKRRRAEAHAETLRQKPGWGEHMKAMARRRRRR